MVPNIHIVHQSVYKNYIYTITHNGFGYCAYVTIPSTHLFYNKSYEEIPISCHGGLSFADIHPILNTYCIGWDYCHAGDWNPTLSNKSDHKWTLEEIENECKNVIDQLISKEG